MLLDIGSDYRSFDPMAEVYLFALMCFPDPRHRAEYILRFKLRHIAKQAEASYEKASLLLKNWLTLDEIKMLPKNPSQETIDKRLCEAAYGSTYVGT